MIREIKGKGTGVRIYLVQKSGRKSIGGMVGSSYFFIPNQKETLDATRHDSITFTSASLEIRGVMEVKLNIFPSMAAVLAIAIKNKRKLKFEIKFTDQRSKRLLACWRFLGRIHKLELLNPETKTDTNDYLSIKVIEPPKSKKKTKLDINSGIET